MTGGHEEIHFEGSDPASESVIEAKPLTLEPTRAKRIPRGLALMGLLGLLTGGGSVLVTKVLLAAE